jgi:hypothetical protein
LICRARVDDRAADGDDRDAGVARLGLLLLSDDDERLVGLRDAVPEPHQDEDDHHRDDDEGDGYRHDDADTAGCDQIHAVGFPSVHGESVSPS